MRSRPLIRALALAGALMAVVAAPAPAQTPAAENVLRDFVTDGRIDPCKHSSGTLRLVLRNIPPDIEQYAPDYPAAVQAALEARARGECERRENRPAAATPTPAPPAPTPAPSAPAPTQTIVPEPPQPEPSPAGPAATDGALDRLATASAGNPVPTPVVLLGGLFALLSLAVLLLVGARRLGWEQGPLAHSWREAGHRTSAWWEDFSDWLRVGR